MIDFLTQFRIHNKRRADQCFVHDTSMVWWTNAIAGEAGEACNLSKKLSRGGAARLSNIERIEAKRALIIEMADVITYADLLLAHMDVSMEDILKEKFDLVSVRCGYPFRFIP